MKSSFFERLKHKKDYKITPVEHKGGVVDFIVACLFIILIIIAIISDPRGAKGLDNLLQSLLKDNAYLSPKNTNKRVIKQAISFPSPIQVSNILYHGTPQAKFADSILFNNKFLIKNHNPQGVYASDKFEVALNYASLNGNIVMILNSIPPWHVIDINEVYKDPRYIDRMSNFGYGGDSLSRFVFEVLNKRLLQYSKNIFVAVVPYNHKRKYYQIEGLTPVKVLDRRGNVIKSISS